MKQQVDQEKVNSVLKSINQKLSHVKAEDQVLVAFDVEATGPRFDNEVNMVGVAFLFPDQKEDFKFEICIKTKNPFDPVCYQEFWSEHLDTLKYIEEHAKEPEEAWNTFLEIWEGFMAMHSNILIVGDCLHFDLPAIDRGLRLYTRRPCGIWYNIQKNNSIHDTVSIDSLTKQVPKPVKDEIKKDKPQNHLAHEDAAFMLKRYLRLKSFFRENLKS